MLSWRCFLMFFVRNISNTPNKCIWTFPYAIFHFSYIFEPRETKTRPVAWILSYQPLPLYMCLNASLDLSFLLPRLANYFITCKTWFLKFFDLKIWPNQISAWYSYKLYSYKKSVYHFNLESFAMFWRSATKHVTIYTQVKILTSSFECSYLLVVKLYLKFIFYM